MIREDLQCSKDMVELLKSVVRRVMQAAEREKSIPDVY
jgi:hypothetical protein